MRGRQRTELPGDHVTVMRGERHGQVSCWGRGDVVGRVRTERRFSPLHMKESRS